VEGTVGLKEVWEEAWLIMANTRKSAAKRTHKPEGGAPGRLPETKPRLRTRQPVCSATKLDGDPCTRPPMPGSTLCRFHTPHIAAELGRKGGRSRAVYLGEPVELPTTPADARQLLATTLVEVKNGKLDPRIAQAVVGCISQLLKAMELEDVVRRVEELKKKMILEGVAVSGGRPYG
jgi:hypothetical protein